MNRYLYLFKFNYFSFLRLEWYRLQFPCGPRWQRIWGSGLASRGCAHAGVQQPRVRCLIHGELYDSPPQRGIYECSKSVDSVWCPERLHLSQLPPVRSPRCGLHRVSRGSAVQRDPVVASLQPHTSLKSSLCELLLAFLIMIFWQMNAFNCLFFFLQNDAHKVRIYTVKHDLSMVPGTNDLICMGSLKP